MRKTLLLLITLLVSACVLVACSNENASTEIPTIDKEMTVAQSLEGSPGWRNIDKMDYSIFPVWENGEQTDYRYALVYDKKASKDGIKRVAAVFYTVEGSEEDYEDDEYLFTRPGMLLFEEHYAELKEGDSFAFGPVPIGEPDGELRDVYVGFSTSGWFEVNGTKVNTRNELVVYVAEHSEKVDFGGTRKFNRIEED